MTVLQKAMATLAVIATMAVVAVWGVRQYGNSRVAAQELGTVKQAVSEAVAARESAVAVDVSQAKENAVQARKVRVLVAQARKKNAEVPKSDCDAVGDAERVRLLNLAIVEANRVISTSGVLPE